MKKSKNAHWFTVVLKTVFPFPYAMVWNDKRKSYRRFKVSIRDTERNRELIEYISKKIEVPFSYFDKGCFRGFVFKTPINFMYSSPIKSKNIDDLERFLSISEKIEELSKFLRKFNFRKIRELISIADKEELLESLDIIEAFIFEGITNKDSLKEVDKLSLFVNLNPNEDGIEKLKKLIEVFKKWVHVVIKRRALMELPIK